MDSGECGDGDDGARRAGEIEVFSGRGRIDLPQYCNTDTKCRTSKLGKINGFRKGDYRIYTAPYLHGTDSPRSHKSLLVLGVPFWRETLLELDCLPNLRTATQSPPHNAV